MVRWMSWVVLACIIVALAASCSSGYWGVGVGVGYTSYGPYDCYDYDPYYYHDYDPHYYYSDCPRHWAYGPLDCNRCHW